MVGTSVEVLDAGAMLMRAEQETGLSDWGDPGFPSRFAIVVGHLNGIALDGLGREKASENINWLLTDRLNFYQDRKDFPLADEVIERPMFATGEPRSGTTLMHALMSVDPDARALRFWEVMHPSPPPGTTSPDDPRIAKANEEWGEINAKMSKWLHCHPYNDMLGNGLPEDERTWAFDFRVMTPTAWWRVPMQNVSFGLPSNAAAQYRIHKAMLQAFQYKRPRKYWVLKGFHTTRLSEMFDAYPDASLVWLHRDPVMVAASSTMMMSDIMEGIVGKIDLIAEAKMQLERVRMSIANTMSDPMTDDARIHHVRYRDFVADPVDTISKFYSFAGRNFAKRQEAEMMAYLRDNKADRHGQFHYSTKVLCDAGYDIDELNEEFRPFRERFDVPIEKRD